MAKRLLDEMKAQQTQKGKFSEELKESAAGSIKGIKEYFEKVYYETPRSKGSKEEEIKESPL